MGDFIASDVRGLFRRAQETLKLIKLFVCIFGQCHCLLTTRINNNSVYKIHNKRKLSKIKPETPQVR